MAGIRKYKRLAINLRVDLLSSDTVFSDFTRNISEGGMCLASMMPIPQNTPVELKFKLPQPDNRSFNLTGRVVWCRSEDEANHPVGIEFDSLHAADSDAAPAFVQSLRTLASQLEQS